MRWNQITSCSIYWTFQTYATVFSKRVCSAGASMAFLWASGRERKHTTHDFTPHDSTLTSWRNLTGCGDRLDSSTEPTSSALSKWLQGNFNQIWILLLRSTGRRGFWGRETALLSCKNQFVIHNVSTYRPTYFRLWPSSILQQLPPDKKQSGISASTIVVHLEILPDTKPRLQIKSFCKDTHVSFQFSPGKDSLFVALIHSFVLSSMMESHNQPLGTKLLHTQVERTQYQRSKWIFLKIYFTHFLSD